MKHRRCRPPPPGMQLTFRCRWRQLAPTLERSLLVGSRRSAANQRECKQRACQGGGRQRGQNKSAPWVHADYTGYIKRACNTCSVALLQKSAIMSMYGREARQSAIQSRFTGPCGPYEKVPEAANGLRTVAEVVSTFPAARRGKYSLFVASRSDASSTWLQTSCRTAQR